MPIYMDRHEIPESVTAEHVAEMHRKDLKIEHLFGCKGMTYWCDEKRRTAFCLIKAPNKKAIQDMHNHAHGSVPHRIIEVDATIVESFLGRIEDPKKSQKTELNIINDPAFRTIVVIELKQISLIQAGQSLINKDSSRLREGILSTIDKFLGRIVKRKMDYFLLSFNSVSNAIQFAEEIILNHNPDAKSSDFNIRINIGMYAGVPVTDTDCIFEDTIKMAKRFCGLGNGKIMISTEVKELFESENFNRKLNDNHIMALSSKDEKFVNLLMDFIEKEWANTSVTSQDFSKSLGYSKSKLYRRMIDITGKSPNSFIKEYRLNKSLELLHKQQSNISEIAFSTGFNSPAYFTKCFKEYYGVLPSRYLL